MIFKQSPRHMLEHPDEGINIPAWSCRPTCCSTYSAATPQQALYIPGILAFTRAAQQQLKPHTAVALKRALPGITDADLRALQKAPARRCAHACVLVGKMRYGEEYALLRKEWSCGWGTGDGSGAED